MTRPASPPRILRLSVSPPAREFIIPLGFADEPDLADVPRDV